MFFFSSRRRHTNFSRDWSSDVCSSDLKSRREAALEAARLRFRPIIMTSLAFILGVLPLALATGAGASARQSMGTGVVFGMLAATFVATLFVPMFFTRLLREGKQRREAGAVEVVSGQDQSQQPPEQK